MKKKYSGINIQFPISRLIVSGEKVVETRTYPIPDKFLKQRLAFIETPGKSGNFKSRIIGFIKFDSCFLYKSEKSFYDDFRKHKVSKESPWAWSKSKPKWGWIISEVVLLKKPVLLNQRTGIRYTNDISI